MSNKRLYHYKECGLDYIYLANGFTFRRSPRGTEAVHIQDIEGLHKFIGLRIVNEKKALTGPEVRFLRHELGLSQQHLGVVLGVDAQTVARWEKGDSDRVSPAADRLIRLLYRQKIEGNPDICESLQRIAELDEIVGDHIERLLLEDDPEEGWRDAYFRPSSFFRSSNDDPPDFS